MRRRSRQPWFANAKGNPLSYVIGVVLMLVFKELFGIPIEVPWSSAPTAARAAGPIAEGEHVVTRVVDGDTLEIEGHLVRLIGIDTPETKHPTKGIEPYGPEATEFSKRFVADMRSKIYLQLDPQGASTDKYGRQLGYVWGNGYLLNEQLLLAGLARSLTDYRFDEGLKSRFHAAEAQARMQARGIWSGQSPRYR